MSDVWSGVLMLVGVAVVLAGLARYSATHRAPQRNPEFDRLARRKYRGLVVPAAALLLLSIVFASRELWSPSIGSALAGVAFGVIGARAWRHAD
jgi:phosphatidylserine synthase